MKTKNSLNHYFGPLALLVAAGLIAVSLTGCGGSDEAKNAVGQSASQANATPPGSGGGSTSTPPAPTPTSGGTATGCVPTQDLIPINFQGQGGYATSGNVSRSVGYADQIGLDSNFRVKFTSSGSAGSSAGAYSHNYTKIQVAVDFVVNGSVLNTQTAFIESASGSAIVDFSATARSISRSSAHQLITLRIRNVKTDWKLVTNWCASETVIVTTSYLTAQPSSSCTPYSGCYGGYCTQWQCPNAYYGICQNGQYGYCAHNVQTYNNCVNNNTPVGALQPSQGWTINGSVEVDGACL